MERSQEQKAVRMGSLLAEPGMQTGFYSAKGGTAARRALIDELMNRFREESRVENPSASVKERRPRIWPAPASVRRIGPVFWLDAAAHFDEAYVGYAAWTRGLSGVRALRAIRVERPVTPTKLTSLLDRVPRASVYAAVDRMGSAVVWTPLVVIDDPLAVFRRVAADAFQGPDLVALMNLLQGLARRAVVVCLLDGRPEEEAARAFIEAQSTRIVIDQVAEWTDLPFHTAPVWKSAGSARSEQAAALVG
jgi:hypothetical protein